MKVGIACTPFEAAAPETEHSTISPKQSEFQQSWSSQDTHHGFNPRILEFEKFPISIKCTRFPPPSHLSTSTLRKTSCEYLLENASYCGAIILHGPHLKNATIWWMDSGLNRSIDIRLTIQRTSRPPRGSVRPSPAGRWSHRRLRSGGQAWLIDWRLTRAETDRIKRRIRSIKMMI